LDVQLKTIVFEVKKQETKMPSKENLTILLAALLIFYPVVVSAEMDSENYHMRSTVISGGGSPIDSANFKMESTVGQPSPLMDSANPPYSDSYDLYPGIWYTFSLVTETCPGDGDGDKDVDGQDLTAFILDDDGLGLDAFAANFGKEFCP
jgi:hypothetical protein